VSARRSLDLQRLAGAYRVGELTPSALVDDLLERLESAGEDGVWIARMAPEELRARAAELDALVRTGAGGPLLAIPFAVKDNIDVAGMPTTAGCPAFATVAERSAPVVERLLEAGALLVGKTNLDQFATGLVGTRSPYGTPRNPIDPRLIPGGSSSGSAVAVSAGLVSFALGTDTAGSGRVPAAYTNVVGLKPTQGMVSTRGVVPACRSLDCVSVFALTVADAQAVLAVAEGYDPLDPWSRRRPEAGPGQNRLRFGVPMAGQLDLTGDREAAELYEETAAHLESLGGVRVLVDLTPFREAAELLYGGPWVAERLVPVGDFLTAHPEAVHPVTRAVLEPGWSHTAVDTFRAVHRLAELRRATGPAWEDVDVLLVPSAPAAYTLEEVAADPLATNARLGTYTNFVNLLDLCALAVPAGFRADGAPVGATLIAPAFADHRLAEIGRRIQDLGALPLGATRYTVPAFPADRASTPPAPRETLDLVVVGTHLSGEPQNHQLTDLGGRLTATTRTAPAYRLHALPAGNDDTPRPGLLRASPGGHDGAAIEAEVWTLSPAAFGAFVAAVPPPLTIGTVALADGTERKGFLCEAHATLEAPDITHHGGWRAYRRSASPPAEAAGSPKARCHPPAAHLRN